MAIQEPRVLLLWGPRARMNLHPDRGREGKRKEKGLLAPAWLARTRSLALPRVPRALGECPPGGGARDLPAPVFTVPPVPHTVRLGVGEALPRKQTWVLLERG